MIVSVHGRGGKFMQNIYQINIDVQYNACLYNMILYGQK